MSLTTLHIFIAIALVAIASTLYRRAVQQLYRKSTKVVLDGKVRRRPTRLPFGIDIVIDIYKNVNRGTVLDAAVRSYQTYGNTFYQRFIGGDFINTIDPANIQAVTSANFYDYEMGTRRREASMPLLGLGIFNNEGDSWRHSRRLFRPAFKNSEMRSLEALFERHFQNMRAIIPRDGSVVDLSELFFCYTMDVSTQYFFGNSTSSLLELNSADSLEETAQTFSRAFAAAQDHIRENYVLGSLAWLRPLKKFHRDRQIVWDLVDRYVHGAVNGFRPEKASQYSVLDHMAETTADPVELRSELIHLLLAARDTTASLLGNLWLVIVQREGVRRTIIEEVKGLGGDLPTYDDLKSLPYLLDCINEGTIAFKYH